MVGESAWFHMSLSTVGETHAEYKFVTILFPLKTDIFEGK